MAPSEAAVPDSTSAVTADALPTVQVNGVVWAQAVIGNTVYATGSFTSARPAGAKRGVNEAPASSILAFDIRTGERITGFRASLNGQGRAIQPSPDGTRIYVGGDFTVANGANRNRLAAFDAATGQLIGSFAPSISGSVTALAVTDEAVYVGGGFVSADAQARTRLCRLLSRRHPASVASHRRQLQCPVHGGLPGRLPNHRGRTLHLAERHRGQGAGSRGRAHRKDAALRGQPEDKELRSGRWDHKPAQRRKTDLRHRVRVRPVETWRVRSQPTPRQGTSCGSRTVTETPSTYS